MSEKPIQLNDPRVQELTRFIETARLSDGRVLNVPVGDRLAQAILNWQQNMVYDQGQWITRADLEHTPDLGGEVEIRTIGDNEAFRLMHRPTGIVALEETRDAAYRALKAKVRAALRDNENEEGHNAE